MILLPIVSVTHPALIGVISFHTLSLTVISASLANPDPDGATGSGSVAISAVKFRIVGGLHGMFGGIALNRTWTVRFPVQIVGTVDEYVVPPSVEYSRFARSASVRVPYFIVLAVSSAVTAGGAIT